MQLSLNNVHHHLIFKGLIQTKDVVLGNYNVEQFSTRNNIIKVRTAEHKYFLKQLTEHSPAARYRIQKDATCLYLIQELPIFQSLRPYVAKYYGYHTDHNILVTELFENVLELDTYFRKQRILEDSIYFQIVDILKSIHVPISHEINASKSLQFFSQSLPWIFEIDETPLRAYSDIRTGQEIAIQYMLRNATIMANIEQARFIWQRSSLIHGDIKFLNFTISPDKDIKIVDWEYADIGDSYWDVAGLIQNVICNKILEFERLLDQGHFHYNIPLELQMTWKLIAKIIQRYNPNIDIKKTITYISVRLLQTAVEYNIRTLVLKPNAQKIINTSLYLCNNIELVKKSISRHINKYNDQ